MKNPVIEEAKDEILKLTKRYGRYNWVLDKK